MSAAKAEAGVQRTAAVNVAAAVTGAVAAMAAAVAAVAVAAMAVAVAAMAVVASVAEVQAPVGHDSERPPAKSNHMGSPLLHCGAGCTLLRWAL